MLGREFWQALCSASMFAHARKNTFKVYSQRQGIRPGQVSFNALVKDRLAPYCRGNRGNRDVGGTLIGAVR
jgi:hypothetical protein